MKTGITNQSGKFMTVGQAAFELGVSTNTVRRLCDENKLRCYRSSRRSHRLIFRDAVVNFGEAPARELTKEERRRTTELVRAEMKKARQRLGLE